MYTTYLYNVMSIRERRETESESIVAVGLTVV